MSMSATLEDDAVKTLVHDRRLLKRYVRDGSEDAFHEIVRRHLRIVYATCLRELHDPALAEDATQIVFLILARKAPNLMLSQSLAGWLFITARFTAIDLRRREQRRREIEAQLEKQQRDNLRYEDVAWGFIDPNLNDALMSLGQIDRQAVLLRFFDQQTFKEVGEHLSLTEAAAERRVSRALVKMRRQLVTAGFAVSISALFALLEERAADAVPQHCLTQALNAASVGTQTSSIAILAKASTIARKMTTAARVARLKLIAGVAGSIVGIVVLQQGAAYLLHRPSTNASARVTVTPASAAVRLALSKVFTPAPTNQPDATTRQAPKPLGVKAKRTAPLRSHHSTSAGTESTSLPDEIDGVLPTGGFVSGKLAPVRAAAAKASTSVTATAGSDTHAELPLFAPTDDSAPSAYKVVAIPDNDPQSLNYEYRHSSYVMPASDLDLPAGINNNDEIVYRCGDVYRWDGDSLDFEHRTYGLPEEHHKAVPSRPTSAMEAIYEQLREHGGKIITRTNGHVTSEVDVPPSTDQDTNAGADDSEPPTYEPAVAAGINDSGDILGICASGVFVSPSGGSPYAVLQTPTRMTDTSILSFDFRGRIGNDGGIAANISTVPSEYRELTPGTADREISFAWKDNLLQSLAVVLDRQASAQVIDADAPGGETQSASFTQAGISGEPNLGGSTFQFGDVNDDGTAVGVLTGVSEPIPICWSNGRVYRLPGLARFANAPLTPRSINGSNDIVGCAGFGRSSIGVLWHHGKAYDLNDLTRRSQWHITRAFGVNDRGEIVALARHGAISCPVLLIPTTSTADVDETSADALP
jgi:RNA polymerase sigma factor (sigma-70 family)